jgi:hypothetical protein
LLSRFFYASAIAYISDIPAASVGTQIVVAVVVGLLTAFAVQFLLTNLGLALGISLLKYRPEASSKQTVASSSEDDGVNLKISFFAGLGILLTLSSVLFIACFLAVRFSTAQDPLSGATLGIVIWSTYFLILIWASYSAVGSVTGWVFGSVATKLRQLIKAIAQAIQGTEKPADELLTEEAGANLIQRELQAALAEFDLQQSIDDYLKTIPSPQLDLSLIEQGFNDLLAKLNLEAFAESKLLQKIDRQTFIALIEERTNLPTTLVEPIVDQLDSVWQQAVNRDKKQDLPTLRQFLQSAEPEELQLELDKRLEQIVGNKSEESQADLTDADVPSPQVDQVAIDDNHNSAIASAQNLDWMAIKNALLNRVDLSEVELADVWHSLQSLYQKFNSSDNIIRNDLEDYLWHAPSWYLNCEKGWQEFKEVIYDPQADPVQIRAQLGEIQRQDLVELLQQRDDLDTQRIEEIVEHLETVKQEVLALIEQTELTELLKDFLQTAELSQLQGDISSRLEQLLLESNVSAEILTQFLSGWQQLDWQTWLQQRDDLDSTKLEQTTEQLSKIGDRLRQKIADSQAKIASTAKELGQKLEAYLRYTNLEHLTSAKIDAKLEQLWQSVEHLKPYVQQQLPVLDRAELIKILERRKGIDADLVETVVTQIETKWQKSSNYVTPEIDQLQTKSAQLSENLVDYLYQAMEQNSTLAEIEADLLPQLNLDREQTKTLVNQQLAQLNWQEIEAKLKQAENYSEQKIQQTIKQIRQATHQLIRLPRRWATRSSQQVKNLVKELEDFFRYGNKIEFTSEHLEQQLRSIFNRSNIQSDPESYTNADDGHPLLALTPADITKSLSLRQDLTPIELQQISDRLVTIIAQLSEDSKSQQEQANELIEDLRDRLGEYFSSLNLFQLDYESIKDRLANFDFQSVTNSWQETIAKIPLEELSDRLGQLSQETLSTVIETNELFYDSTLAQIQGIQDYVAQQIETVKMTVSERTETLKQQTLQQVETARKAIATAVYWMFAITFTSAVASAVAGFLATTISF